MAGERAHGQRVAGLGDVVQRQATDVDDVSGRGQPELHDGDQALPAGQHLGVVPVLGQELERLLQRLGPVVLEPRRQHQ
jgi:hypothetical protein